MILNIFSNKDVLLFLVVVALVVISMLMVFIVYSENRQLKKQQSPKNLNNKEIKELQELSKQLELVSKNNTSNINLTAYEEEQEEKAIISYDELVKNRNNVSIGYENEELVDDIKIKKVDFDKTGEIELDPIKKEMNSKVTLVSYEHEEEFLTSLKKLQYLITK